MADIFSKEKRSLIMANIKGKNTSIEKEVFSYLKTNKIYFQKHYRRAPGSPDVALPNKKKAIFIDGDFWHGWELKKRENKLPIFWKKKILNNITRDRRNRKILRKEGWEILVVWEHQLEKQKDRYLKRIANFLTAD